MRIRKVDIRCSHCGTMNHKQQVLSYRNNVRMRHRFYMFAQQKDMVYMCKKM